MSLSKGYIRCGVENNQVGVRGWEGPWRYCDITLSIGFKLYSVDVGERVI